jgi:hypothetical protein
MNGVRYEADRRDRTGNEKPFTVKKGFERSKALPSSRILYLPDLAPFSVG